MEKNGYKKFTVFVEEVDDDFVWGVSIKLRIRGLTEGWSMPKGYMGDTKGTDYGWEVYLWAKDEKEAKELALERIK